MPPWFGGIYRWTGGESKTSAERRGGNAPVPEDGELFQQAKKPLVFSMCLFMRCEPKKYTAAMNGIQSSAYSG